jgi:hypothetical protein
MTDPPRRIDLPSADDIGGAVRDGHAIVAFAARSRDDLLFLKLATRASGAVTLSFDPMVAQWLYTTLGDYLRLGTKSPESEAKWTDGEFTDAQGDAATEG